VRTLISLAVAQAGSRLLPTAAASVMASAIVDTVPVRPKKKKMGVDWTYLAYDMIHGQIFFFT
jgi:hypothetical protein